MTGSFLPMLLRIEAVCAGVTLILCLWPLTRAFSALIRELRTGGARAIIAMLIVWLVAVLLRLVVVNPTFLSNLPDLHMHFERLFSPLGRASTWHHHHGMGGYILHAGLAQIFGKSYQTVWMINGLVGSLAPALLYLVVLKLVADRRVAFLAAALLAVFPPSIRVDASEQFHSLSIALVLLTYFSTLKALERPTLKTWLAAGLAGAAAMHMRAEALPHVFFACVLTIVKIQGMARPRWGLPLVLAILVLSVPAIPRILTTLQAMMNEGLSAWGASSGVFADLFFSERHVYLNPHLSLPIYPVLTLAGVASLALARSWQLLAFTLVVLVVQSFAYFNEWTFDTNEALRFQAHIWFMQIILAGIGLAWLSRLARNQTIQGLVACMGIAIASLSLLPARQILLQPQGADQDVLFFAEQLPRLPRDCRLVMLRVSHESTDGYFGPGTRPDWLLEKHGRNLTLSYPEDLDAMDSSGDCHVGYVGIDCYRRYPGDSLDEEQVRKNIHEAGHPILYEIIDSWRSQLDRHPPPLMRPECAELFDRFRTEPLVELRVSPSRPTWIWSPDRPITIGFYRMN
jgi:hypothetical protein